MNILHLKYAVEVAKRGTLSKASEALLIGQPNLSRAIKELENSIGITIFYRTGRGMAVTEEGERFLNYAKSILHQIEYVESIYGNESVQKQRFSVSVPRVSYIAEAFTHFSRLIDADSSELLYMETNTMRTIDNLVHSDYRLGIIRYAKNYERYFLELLEDKNLPYETIADFNCLFIMSAEHPLAGKDTISPSDMEPYIELLHADQYVPALSCGKGEKSTIRHHIYMFDRASRFDLLSENNRTFIRGGSLPENILKRYNLVQKKCAGDTTVYRDILIHRRDYNLTNLDSRFIEELNRSKEGCL